MCENWLPSGMTAAAFLEHLKNRARARRLNDLDYRGTRDKDDSVAEMNPAPHPSQREGADLCYAYSAKTGHYYVGYSGPGGGMTARVPYSHPPEYYDVEVDRDGAQSDRRKARFNDAVGGAVAQKMDRPVHNCAEACALSIARAFLDESEDLADLVFITFAPERMGHFVKDPCKNCMEWIVRARAFCDRAERFHCQEGS